MDNGSVGGQVATQIKDLGQETGKQLSRAGEEIVKGTVDQLFGENVRVRETEQGVVSGANQQVTAVKQMDELRQRKEAERKRGLERVRKEMANYANWKKQMEEEVSGQEERKEARVKMVEKKEKKNFWRGLIGKNRSKYAGTGEVIKAHN